MRGGVMLKAGVMYCLRRFQPLIQLLCRGHWVNHIKHNRLNHALLGSSDDLASFLFETDRKSLQLIGNRLKRLADGKCFYCGSRVHDSFDVDHFVPFSLYPRDQMHNFVLSHPTCNRSKSDTLAAKPHLEHWLAYITTRDDDLQEIGLEAGRVCNRQSALAVAQWGYANAESVSAQAWLKAAQYEAVDGAYLQMFD